jgi:ribosomal protein S18 acetylase RimI-like enzyme
MDVSFVPAQPADQQMLLDLIRQLREEDPDEGPFDLAGAKDATRQLLSDPSVGRIWLIRSGEQIAGYVVLTLGYSIEFGGRIAFVDELLIDRAYRGRGIGRAAMRFVEARAREIGVRVLLLEVTRSNESARGLYRSAGYVDRPHQLMTKRTSER